MGVLLKAVERGDLPAVAELIATVFERPVPVDGARRLEWLLFKNPDATPETSKGWLLEEGGRPVGFLANVARKMFASGREYLAACTAKFVVLPAYRLQGLLLAKAFFEQKNVDCLFCSTGSEASAPVLRRFGAVEISGGDEAAVFVLRAPPVVHELMRRRGYEGRLARLVSGGVGAALSVVERVRISLPRCPADLRVEPMAGFDEELDGLWKRWQARLPATSYRDSAHLQWLFREGPSSRPTTHLWGTYRGLRLEGYAVCQDRGQTAGVRRREVMDLFAPSGADAFEALIGTLIDEAQSDEMDTLEFRSLPGHLMERLAEWGARRRRLEVNPFLVKPVRPGLSLPAQDASAWHLVPADGDGAGW